VINYEDDQKEVWAFGWKVAGRLEMTVGGGEWASRNDHGLD